MALKKVGALWKKEGKKGTFLSGEIEIGKGKVHILVFKNQDKESDNQPDYRIMLAEDDDEPRRGKPERQEKFQASDEEVPF